MDQMSKTDRHLGTWSFLRPGWWILHIAAISLIFWLGTWMAARY